MRASTTIYLLARAINTSNRGFLATYHNAVASGDPKQIGEAAGTLYSEISVDVDMFATQKLFGCYSPCSLDGPPTGHQHPRPHRRQHQWSRCGRDVAGLVSKAKPQEKDLYRRPERLCVAIWRAIRAAVLALGAWRWKLLVSSDRLVRDSTPGRRWLQAKSVGLQAIMYTWYTHAQLNNGDWITEHPPRWVSQSASR